MDFIAPSNASVAGPLGTPLFTCNTCGLTFPTADLQRLHMKSDWHRYNLKRRVANLPPISSEVFAEKVLQQENLQQHQEVLTGRGSGNRQVTKKDKKKEEKLMRKIVLNRSLRDSNTEQHDPVHRAGSPVSSTFSLGEPLESVPSQDGFIGYEDSEEGASGEATEETADSTETVQSTSEYGSKSPQELGELGNTVSNEQQTPPSDVRAIPANICLVNGKIFSSVEENVAFMSKTYGLFVPEREYLQDLQGLMEYLGKKVGLGHLCLLCSFQGRSLESVQAHMLAKGHVKIPYESIEEKLEISKFYDFRGSYANGEKASNHKDGGDEEDWEDASDGSYASDGADSDTDDVIPEDDGMYLDSSGYELSIAPGVRVGHRAMARYFKQNLRPDNSWDGQNTVSTVNRRELNLAPKDIQAEKAKTRAWRSDKKSQNVHNRRDKNINNQNHYRDELLQ